LSQPTFISRSTFDAFITCRRSLFTIEIEEDKDVSILKKMIKEETAFTMPAKELTLLQLSLPLDDIDTQLSILDPDKCPKLSPISMG